jgi:hypothetical protein
VNDDLLGHLAYKIANAPLRLYPFPHIFVEEVLPRTFYSDLQTNLQAKDDYREVEGKYKGRKFGNPDDLELLDPFKTKEFAKIALKPFADHISERFEGKKQAFHTDLRLVRDSQNYSIGPHTDAPWKVLSYLFYLPNGYSLSDHGTSIYLPRDPSFRCKGGPHHPHADFTRIATMPYIPNSLFAFFKTDNSFHGVEPITIPCRRDVLLWNLYAAKE